MECDGEALIELLKRMERRSGDMDAKIKINIDHRDYEQTHASICSKCKKAQITSHYDIGINIDEGKWDPTAEAIAHKVKSSIVADSACATCLGMPTAIRTREIDKSEGDFLIQSAVWGEREDLWGPPT